MAKIFVMSLGVVSLLYAAEDPNNRNAGGAAASSFETPRPDGERGAVLAPVLTPRDRDDIDRVLQNLGAFLNPDRYTFNQTEIDEERAGMTGQNLERLRFVDFAGEFVRDGQRGGLEAVNFFLAIALVIDEMDPADERALNRPTEGDEHNFYPKNKEFFSRFLAAGRELGLFPGRS